MIFGTAQKSCGGMIEAAVDHMHPFPLQAYSLVSVRQAGAIWSQFSMVAGWQKLLSKRLAAGTSRSVLAAASFPLYNLHNGSA